MDEYAQNEKKKILYADVVNSAHVNNINLSDIHLDLLKGEENNSSKTDTSLSYVCTNSAQGLNHSRSLEEESDNSLSSQDKEILSILEEMENKNDISNINSKSSLTDYFCSNTVFNLSRKVLSDTEIKILEKSLYYAAIQNKVNEPELRQDFDEFS